MSGLDKKKMDEMLAKLREDDKKLQKEMGLDGNSSDGDDPDLKEIAKHMKKLGKLDYKLVDVFLDNAKDDEMDDDELAAELDDMEDEDLGAARVYCQTLQAQVEEEKKQALAQKKAGNIPLAQEHLKKMKEHQRQLEEQFSRFPKLDPKHNNNAKQQQVVEKPAEPKVVEKAV